MRKFVKVSFIAACLMALVFTLFRLALMHRTGSFTGRNNIRVYDFFYEGNLLKIKRDPRNNTDIQVLSTVLSRDSQNTTSKTKQEPQTARTTKPVLVSHVNNMTTPKPASVINDKKPTVNTKPRTTQSITMKETPNAVSSSTSLNCSKEGENLVGALAVDQTVPVSFDNIQDPWKNKNWVHKGGAWKPTKCQPVNKAAIIIPYRRREEQLKIFLRHIHPMLKRQLLDYRIMVIEQDGDTPFNRALLFNIGYKEALKFNDFNCFVFHDVDLIPESDHNYYGCPTSPRHLSVAIDKFKYRLPYSSIFGGAGSFTRKHFEQINGFSNTFWGWGGEDDDLFKRIQSKKLHLTRPSMIAGRYKMVRIHHQSAKPNPSRFDKLRASQHRMANDGLNTLKYHVKAVMEEPFYTKVTVEVNPSELQK